METFKNENLLVKKSNQKKPIKKINYKVESEKLKTELTKLKNTANLDFNKSISLDFTFTELFWLKDSIGKLLIEIEGDLAYYDHDEKLPPKKSGHKFIITKLKVLEGIYNKIDCLTI